MRILISSDAPTATSNEVDDATLARLYAADPAHSPVGDGVWLRVNMVSTVDGSAQGEDGASGSINNAADKRVYDLLRAQADVVVVGAGTARDEGYGPADVPLVVVSRSGRVPEKLRGHAPGRVRLATVEKAERLAEARELLGDEHVWTLGGYAINRGSLRARLAQEGFAQVLAEGGPHLFRDMLNAEVVDEVCLTVVPRLVAGDHARITAGGGIDVPLTPTLLLEESGTLLGRWRVVR
ncbi:dihydrofolate reductase family protein [Nocardioides yefusunii]|uniref:Dihydrofolate reductase family protein n=1 Tax=Nocardioides yefusunii TaxID=2500546 RepID=A0ABW1QTQ2_9ACTN|nr:dihydrofolate reductase family protein [Nocardioides yefusunii]